VQRRQKRQVSLIEEALNVAWETDSDDDDYEEEQFFTESSEDEDDEDDEDDEEDARAALEAASRAMMQIRRWRMLHPTWMLTRPTSRPPLHIYSL
jgi:hypothetical protein